MARAVVLLFNYLVIIWCTSNAGNATNIEFLTGSKHFPVVIEAGDSSSFNCSTSNETAQVSLWYKSSKSAGLKDISKDPRVKLNGQIFQLSNATLSDKGIYFCKAKDVNGQQIKHKLCSLLVLKAEPLKWIGEFGGGIYYYGDPLVFNCNLTQPRVSVTLWHRKSGEGYKQRIPDAHLQQNNQIFKIGAVYLNDGGEYECRAANIKPHTILRVFVTQEGIPRPKPKIKWHRGIIELGSEVTLECEGTGHVFLTWFKRNLNGSLTKLAGTVRRDHGALSGMTRTTNTYTIRHFHKKDNGQYRCVLERPLVKWRAYTEEPIESKNYEKPKFLQFPSEEVYINEEDYGTFDYRPDGSPYPSVTWYEVKADNSEERVAYCRSEATDDSSCDMSDTRKFAKLCGSTSTLAFFETYVEVFDACASYNLKFKAVLNNTYGLSASKTFRIIVKEKPTIQDGKDFVSMYRNSPETGVSCAVKPILYPKDISFTWRVQTYSDSGCIKTQCQPDEKKWITIQMPSKYYHIKSGGFKSVLTLRNNTKPRFIQCIANNSHGRDNHEWKLIILADSRKLLKSLKSLENADEGEDVTLACEGDNTLLSRVIWKKGDVEISTGPRYNISKQQRSNTGDMNYFLNIRKTNVSDGGMYKCIGIRDNQGPVIENILLVVHEFISPVVHLANKTVRQSASFKVMCNATGYPKPTITWRKGGGPLPLSDSIVTSCQKSVKSGIYRIRKDDNAVLLVCSSDYKKHSGLFTCMATNSLGNASASAEIHITASPVIVADLNGRYDAEIGESFNLSCSSDGNPSPDVSWQKEVDDVFKPLEGHPGSELKFTVMKREHIGTYRCVAVNKYGNATRVVELVEREQASAIAGQAVDNSSKSWLIGVGVISAAFCLSLIACVVILYRRKKEYGGFYVFTPIPITDYIKKLDPHKPIIEQTNKLPYDPEWEFPRNRLKFSRELGSGAFGKVFLAEALGIVAFDPRGSIKRKSSKRRFGGSLRKNQYVNNTKMTKVAVKTLKEDSGEAEYKDLLSELKILIHVGEHKNIVNLLGACTKGRESELWIIIEFCLNGNLLQFLRNRRDIYEPEWKGVSKDPNMQLTMTDLVVAAYQTARGMEFLASRMCIHRDLATRNILVTDNYVIKIADFGLARDMGTDSQYVKTSTGLLPVKWMAIEAIIERLFTEKSDVWSFGIVLWELFTLGGTPYPNISANEVSEYLALGNRMSPPHACPDEISSLMNSCWQDDRDDRPNFKELVEMLDKIIEVHTSSEGGCGYLEVTGDEVMNDYLRPSEIKSPQMDPFELNSPLPALPSPGDNESDSLLLKDQNGRPKLFDFDKSIRNKAARHDSELEKVEKDSEPERKKDTSREGSDIEVDGYIDTSLTGKERDRLEQDQDKDRDSSEEPRLQQNYAYWKKSAV